MTPKKALKLILEYVNLDEYDYETKGIRNAETLLKQALTELEVLKRDLTRIFELTDKPYKLTTHEDFEEIKSLEQELRKKVGK